MNTLISGISSGFGEELAKVLQSSGYSVTGIGRCGSQGIDNFQADFDDIEALERLLDQTKQNFELVILNAGTLGLIAKPNEIGREEFERSMRVNVVSNKIMLDWAIQNGCQNFIVISSGAANKNYHGWLNYCVGKAALKSLICQYSLDIPDIKFKLVAPGILKTKMNSEILKADITEFPDLKKFHDTTPIEPSLVAKFLLDRIDYIFESDEIEIDLRNLPNYPVPS